MKILSDLREEYYRGELREVDMFGNPLQQGTPKN